MVYYFYTKYARDDIRFLVSNYPSYRFYTGQKLREKDIVIIAIYLNLPALAEFANLMGLLTDNKEKYDKVYPKQFRIINLNYNDESGHFSRPEYIYHQDLNNLYERKNSKLLLYNSWETRDLYKCHPVIMHYCRYHHIPKHKFILSMTDHQHIWKKYPYPRVIFI